MIHLSAFKIRVVLENLQRWFLGMLESYVSVSVAKFQSFRFFYKSLDPE